MVLQHLWVGVSENGRWWGRLERFVFLVGELVAKSHPSSGTRLYAVRVAFHLQDYFGPRVLQAEVQAADAREQGHRLYGRFRAGAARDGEVVGELGPRGKTKGRPLGRRDESRKFFKARTRPDCGLTVLKVCLGVTLNTAPTALKTKTSGVVYLVTIYASLTHGVLAGTQSTSSPAPPNHSAISRSADSTESLP